MQQDDAPPDMDIPQSTKRLAVLETEAHAEEVVACNGGKDLIEYTYAAHGDAPSPLGVTGWRAAPDWENHRPLEVRPTPPPRVPYPASWDTSRGRFCALGGVGGHALHILRARKNF